jgi:hypothetical protein
VDSYATVSEAGEAFTGPGQITLKEFCAGDFDGKAIFTSLYIEAISATIH